MARRDEKMRALFVAEYIKDFNATRAAKDAGYSKKTARTQGSRLLENVDIQEQIASAIEKRMKRVQVDADYVLHRLVEMDQLDVADILNDDHSLKSVHQWPEAWRRSISALDIKHLEKKGENIDAILKKLKWPSKERVLELIGKHVNVQAFEERATVTHQTLAEKMAAARARANGE